MKNLVSIVLVGLLVGCANPYAEMRDANRSAIGRVELGMSKHQLFALMGPRSATGSVYGTIENPYRRETVVGVDGEKYEVLYYYTDLVGQKSIESGLTPVVIKNEKVIGIGWSYLDGLLGNSPKTIRMR